MSDRQSQEILTRKTSLGGILTSQSHPQGHSAGSSQYVMWEKVTERQNMTSSLYLWLPFLLKNIFCDIRQPRLHFIIRNGCIKWYFGPHYLKWTLWIFNETYSADERLSFLGHCLLLCSSDPQTWQPINRSLNLKLRKQHKQDLLST